MGPDDELPTWETSVELPMFSIEETRREIALSHAVAMFSQLPAKDNLGMNLAESSRVVMAACVFEAYLKGAK